jgi:hypothetical protein
MVLVHLMRIVHGVPAFVGLDKELLSVSQSSVSRVENVCCVCFREITRGQAGRNKGRRLLLY